MKVLITSLTFKNGPEVGDICEVGGVVAPVGLLPVHYKGYYCDISHDLCHVIQPAWQVMKEAEETGREVDVWNKNKKEWVCKGKCYGWFVDEVYRISPQPANPVIVPYKWEDRDKLRGLWVRHIEDEYETQVGYLDKENIATLEGTYSWEDFHKYHTLLNGSPIGKEVTNG